MLCEHSKQPIIEDTVRKFRRGLTGYADLDERQVESAAVGLILSTLSWEPFPWDRRNQYRIEGRRKVDTALGELWGGARCSTRSCSSRASGQ